MTQSRVLPADVYDALEFSALAFGGIGSGRWFVNDDAVAGDPVCGRGHAIALGSDEDGEPAIAALNRACINIADNDKAVRRANRRRRQPAQRRVSFADWCAELGVERGL